MTRQRVLQTLLGLVISAGCLWLVLRDVPFEQVIPALRQAHFWWLAPALIALAVDVIIRAERWGVLLRPIATVSWKRLLSPTIIGYMGNALLPARLGEVLRATLLGSRSAGCRARRDAPERLDQRGVGQYRTRAHAGWDRHGGYIGRHGTARAASRLVDRGLGCGHRVMCGPSCGLSGAGGIPSDRDSLAPSLVWASAMGSPPVALGRSSAFGSGGAPQPSTDDPGVGVDCGDLGRECAGVLLGDPGV